MLRVESSVRFTQPFSRSRCRVREKKGASYALSASARPAAGASREGGEGGGGNTHSRWRRIGRARTRYGVAQDGEKKGLFDGGGEKKNEVSIQCCGGDSVEWTAR